MTGSQSRFTAVIGLGNMGLPLAQRLCESGHQLVVADVKERKTRVFRANHPGVADFRSFVAIHNIAHVLLVVEVANELDEVLFGAPSSEGCAHHGLAARLPAGTPVLLMPTISARDAERIGQRLDAMGLLPLDAPMSGGPKRARDGSMSLMVSGSDLAWHAAQPLLQSLSSQVTRVSNRLGDAMRLKLINNQLAAVHLHAAAQAHALVLACGLDPALAWSVIGRSSGQSWIADDRVQRFLAGDAQCHAHTGLLAKDSALAMELAQSVHCLADHGDLAAAAFAAAVRRGLAQSDDSQLFAPGVT